MQFKERIRERMNQKSLDTKEFAKRLCNYGSDSDLWESNEHKSSYMRKIQKWLAGDAEPANIEELKKICDILDCDFSYLLGDNSIGNLNNKKVADYMGLDEITISNIRNYDNVTKSFMSLLIRANECNEKMGDILHDFIEKMLFLSQNSFHTTVTIENDISGKKESLRGEAAFNYILPAIKKMMEPIFYKVAILGIDINSKKYDMELEKRDVERKKKTERLLNEIMELTGKSREEIFKDIEKHKKK